MGLEEALIDVLADSDFSELCYYQIVNADVNAAWTSLYARITRQDSPFMPGNRASGVNLHAMIKVLSTVHATYGGIVLPTVGMNFKIARANGGALEAGWIVESIHGNAGAWNLIAVKRDQSDHGKKSLESGSIG